jgi:hypothetical protein
LLEPQRGRDPGAGVGQANAFIGGFGFTAEDMDRSLGRRRTGVTATYHRNDYRKRDRMIMEAESRHVMGLIDGRPAEADVIELRRA